MGQVGIMPDDFYRMTLKEAILKGESWQINQSLEWERTRYLSTITKNAGIVARGGRVSGLDQPTDLFSLPQDKVLRGAASKARKSTVEKFKAFFQKAKERGVDFKETPNFEKLKESHG